MTDRDNYWTTLLARRHSRRRFLGIAAGVGVSYAGLSVVGCTGQKASPSTSGTTTTKTPKAGGVVKFGMYADAPDFDPHMATNLPMLEAGTLAYSQLLRFKTGREDKVGEWQMVNDLAEKYEQPDPTTYVFQLRPGVKWHDGTDFTSDDVKFTFERIATPQAVFQRNYMFEPVAKMETPDKTTIRVTLKQPFAPFLNYVANPWTKIVSRKVTEKEGDLKKVQIGTGPFKLKEYRRDVGWTFVKNPDYFIKDRPYVDGVNLDIQLDNATRLSNFRAGNLDILDDLAGLRGDTADLLKKSNPNVVIERFPEGSWIGLALRSDRPPFDNLKVRQAVAMALDYQQMIDTVFAGDGFLQGTLPASMGKWAVPFDKLNLPKKDIARAKQLLAEAGYPNGFKTTGVTTVNHPKGVDSWQVMKPQMAQIGIDVEPKVMEFAAYQTARTKGDFEMAYIPFITYIDPDEWLFPFYHSTKGTRNAGHWADPEFDKLLEKQRSAVNEAERIKVLQDIQMDLAKKLWFIPMPQEYRRMAWHSYVVGYQSTYTTFYSDLLRDVWLDK